MLDKSPREKLILWVVILSILAAFCMLLFNPWLTFAFVFLAWLVMFLTAKGHI